MKLILINNYEIPFSKSMDLYTKSIQKGLKKNKSTDNLSKKIFK